MSTLYTMGGEWVKALTEEDREKAIWGGEKALREYVRERNVVFDSFTHRFDLREATECVIDGAFKEVFGDG